MEDEQSSVAWSEEGDHEHDASVANGVECASVEQSSVVWSENEQDASDTISVESSSVISPSPRVPVREREEPLSDSESREPLLTGPQTPGGTAATAYENVYCGDLEGKMDVTDEGIKFVPYVALPQGKIPILHDIPWKEITYREFFKEDIKAGYKSYSTMITLFNFKIGVLPSREAKFSFRRSEEYDRFMCDLDARGYGAPPPPPPPPTQSATTTTPAAEDPWFHPDDYDHPETVYHDDDDDDDEAEYDANRAAAAEGGEEDENEDVDEARSNMRQTPSTEHTDDDGDYSVNLGWSTEDAGTAGPIPNSSYYPVTCKRELGSLVLTDKQLQFVPDRHSATIKSIPYPAFAGRPFFSPWNYPRAQMAIHYHTTRGPNKKVGFDLPSHDELLRLEDDIRDRMRPFKNAPREQVYVPPKMPEEDEEPSVSKPRGGGGSVRSSSSSSTKKKKFAPPLDPSVTEEETSYGGGGETYITAAQGVPLMANTARRVPYHKEEHSRRLVLLFISYCCIVTLTGLTLSILFGYYFGPRRPKEQYIRTKPPHDIVGSYLGTEPPTMAPTPKKINAWEGNSVTMSRSVTQPPEATVELSKPPEAEVTEEEEKAVTVGNNFVPGIGAGIGRPVTPSNQVDLEDNFGPGIGTGIGRPMPGSNVNVRPGSGMGSGGSIRGSDFEMSTSTVASSETLLPTLAPTGGDNIGPGLVGEISRPLPGPDTNRPGSGMGDGGSIRGSDFDLSTSTLAPIETTIPSTLAPTEPVATDPPTAASSPTAPPTTGTPTTAPSTGTPTIAPSTGTPTVAPSTETPTVAPSTETPTVAPSTGSPTIAPSTAAPTISPTTTAPTVVPTVLVTRSSKAIVQLLMDKSPDKGQNLRTPGTPQQAAYLMMKVSGLLDSAPSDETIVQKYAMATLYYAAGGNDWKKGSDDWKDLAGSDCNKADIMCDGASEEPIGINMPKNNMKGSIPAEIGLLDKLKFISFQENDLVGAVPSEIGLLTNLETLDLSGNPKLGALPEEVRTLPRLTTIKIDN